MANTQTLDMTRGKPLPILVRLAHGPAGGLLRQLLPDLCVLPHGLGTGLRLLCWPVRLFYSEKNQRICC